MPKRKIKTPKIFFEEIGDKPPNGKRKLSPFGEMDPNTGDIFIDPRQCESEMLDTLIHELMHYCFPKMSEEKVHNSSSVISHKLWELGYRNKNLKTNIQ